MKTLEERAAELVQSIGRGGPALPGEVEAMVADFAHTVMLEGLEEAAKMCDADRELYERRIRLYPEAPKRMVLGWSERAIQADTSAKAIRALKEKSR